MHEDSYLQELYNIELSNMKFNGNTICDSFLRLLQEARK